MTLPTFVYDDECGFCSWWARTFAEQTDFGIVGFSSLTDEERNRLPDNYEDCAHLLTADAVFSCGAAVEEGLRRAGVVPEEILDFLGQFTDYPMYREWVYREAADRRDLWGFLLASDPPPRRDPGED